MLRECLITPQRMTRHTCIYSLTSETLINIEIVITRPRRSFTLLPDLVGAAVPYLFGVEMS
jgi:hypothetical protein